MTTATEIRELPILFSAPMVRSILAGHKGQTRRVITPQPAAPLYHLQGTSQWAPLNEEGDGPADTRTWHRCPYGQAGDRLWVRETLRLGDDGVWVFAADGEPVGCDRADEAAMIVWAHHKEGTACPSIHMPKWAARLWLEVLDVRAEPLQAITEADAQAEGAELAGDDEAQDGAPDAPRAMSYRAGFAALWDSINGHREGCAWRDSPWVWRIEFRRIAL